MSFLCMQKYIHYQLIQPVVHQSSLQEKTHLTVALCIYVYTVPFLHKVIVHRCVFVRLQTKDIDTHV